MYTNQLTHFIVSLSGFRPQPAKQPFSTYILIISPLKFLAITEKRLHLSYSSILSETSDKSHPQSFSSK